MSHLKDEQILGLTRRLNSAGEGIAIQNTEMENLRRQLAISQTDRARLESEALSARVLVQTVTLNQNAAVHDANQEAVRLRNLCKKHGIDPDSE
jgi:hypothetical protein